jgi:hypothetical protein
VARRTRSEALALAATIRADLHEHPENFERWVGRACDHEDALRGGDFGSWSTHERSPLAREVEVVSRLNEGEVSQPFDSLVGIQIAKRTAVTNRPTVSMHTVRLQYVEQPESPAMSREVVQAKAQALATLALDSRVTHPWAEPPCCREQTAWTTGRGVPKLERELLSLALDERSTRPVELDSSFYLIRRVVPPAPSVPAPIRTSLPTASELPLRDLLTRLSAGEVEASVLQLGIEANETLGIEKNLQAKLLAQHQGLGVGESSDDTATLAEVHLSRTEALLGADEARRYRELARQIVVTRLLARD